MAHVYAKSVLERVLPLLHREQFREVRREVIASNLGIPTAWVVEAFKGLIEADYLEVKKTAEGGEEYRPNVAHPELAGLF